MKFSSLKTDAARETEGVWVEFGDGAEVLVARAGNSRHEALARKLRKPHEVRFRNGNLPPDLELALGIEAMAQTILLDWRGFEDDAGQPVPYSTEAARQKLAELRDFREAVSLIASDMELYRTERMEEAADLGKGASDGILNGEQTAS